MATLPPQLPLDLDRIWTEKLLPRVTVRILTAGKAVTVKLKLAASMAAVYPGGSTVLAAVVIVVKHRACLLVGLFRRQIGTESYSRVSS